jgi:hypothetical protein
VAARSPRYEVFEKVFAVVLIFMIAGLLYVHRRIAPRLARLRPIKPGEGVMFPLEIHKEAMREQERLEDEIVKEMAKDEAAMVTQTHPWTCEHCREENPAELLLCWKCEGPSPAISNKEVTLNAQP